MEEDDSGHKEDLDLWSPPKNVPIDMSRLKTLFITVLKRYQVDIEVAKYMLKCGQALHKMIISACGDLSAKELYREFLMAAKGSTYTVKFI